MNLFGQTTRKDPGWSPSINFCAQSAHLFAGAYVVSNILAKGFSPWWILVAVVIAGLKEISDSTFFEVPPDDWGWPGSFEDWTMYLVGGAIGWFTWWI